MRFTFNETMFPSRYVAFSSISSGMHSSGNYITSEVRYSVDGLSSGLSLINSRISIICADPNCTTIFLLFSHPWSRASFTRSRSSSN